MGGFMGFTGHPGGPPTKVGVPVGDINAGMFLAFGIVSALYRRAKTGEGQLVETSLYEGQLAQLVYQAGRWFADPDDVAGRDGNRHPLIVPYATYQTRDGWVNVAVGSPGLWDRFCKALDLGAVHRDPRFVDNAARVAHREQLDAILVPRLKRLDTDELLRLLGEAGVPCGPVATMDEILTDPHAKAREMVVEVPHSELGHVKVMGLPVKLSATPGRVRTGPPVLGEHSESLRAEFSR
jgi:formyl-CoA transferase/CoA:oxalate CoA-transferase